MAGTIALRNGNYVKLLNGLGINPCSNFSLLGRERSMVRAGTTMHRQTEPLAAMGQQIDAALARIGNSRDLGSDLIPILDIAIGLTGADMGTLQRFDEDGDCLELVASRGFSSQALSFFGIVRRDTNSSCAAAFTRRMRVFVENLATSYLYVGTRELDVLSADGVAAVQSTPLISSSGRLWGVLSTHFRRTQLESAFDHAPLDRLAIRIADSLEQRYGPVPDRRHAGRSDGGE
jgi:hypothetical protein